MVRPACVVERTVDGSDRGETIRGTSRAERSVAFGGNDRISSANGVAETVRCGSGRDMVRADRSDRLIGCERVKRVSVPLLPAARPRVGGPQSTFTVSYKPLLRGIDSIIVTPRCGAS